MRYAAECFAMERDPKQLAESARQWCNDVAALGVDALMDAKLIPKTEFERAKNIVATEIFVRLRLGDYPPQPPAGEYL